MSGIFEKEEKQISEGIESFYNKWAGQVGEFRGAKLDQYNNPIGDEYDLAKPMAFEGFFVIVYSPDMTGGTPADMNNLVKVLKEKGFSYKMHKDYTLPDGDQLKEELDKACVFILASCVPMDSGFKGFTPTQLQLIKNFWLKGGGLYLWTENSTTRDLDIGFFTDTNQLIAHLWGSGYMIKGDENGGRVIGQQTRGGSSTGFVKHLITTGLKFIHEGETISIIPNKKPIKPLMWSSTNTIAIGYVDSEASKGRMVFDSGYTKWNEELFFGTPGTARYCANAICWLVNIERYLNFETASFKITLTRPKTELGTFKLKKGERKIFGRTNLGVADQKNADLVSDRHFSVKFILQKIVLIQNLGVHGLTLDNTPIAPNKIVKARLPFRLTLGKTFNFDLE
jgi:hypothetical protein